MNDVRLVHRVRTEPLRGSGRLPANERSSRRMEGIQVEGAFCEGTCCSCRESPDEAETGFDEDAVGGVDRRRDKRCSSAETSWSDTTHWAVAELTSFVSPFVSGIGHPFPRPFALDSFWHGYLESVIYTHRTLDRCEMNEVREVSRDR